MKQTAVKILTLAKEKFMRYGIRSVSMDDIARDLGMSKKTLYTHFRTKQGLVETIAVKFIEVDKQEIERISKNSENALDEIVQVAAYVIQTLRKVPEIALYDMKKYYHGCWNHFDRFHKEFIYNTIYANIERGKEEGLYRADADAEILARLYVGKSMLITDQDMFPMHQYPKADLFRQLILYHIHGLASEKGLMQLEKYFEAQQL